MSLAFSKLTGLGHKDGVEGKDEKKQILKNFVDAYNNFSFAPNDNWQGSLGGKCVHVVGTAAGRILINQQSSVLENSGLCFHRNFGLPYIPGSAIKGATRHYAWEQWKNCQSDDEKRNLAKQISDTFGYPTNDKGLDNFIEKNGICKSEASGNVAFLAAVAQVSKKTPPPPQLVMEVATPHHKDYYGGKGTKAFDNEDPVPIFFPAIEAGTKFDFFLVALKKDADLEFAKKMLEGMLCKNGIGAKTASGFGWFDKTETVENTRQNPSLAKWKEKGISEIKKWLKEQASDADIKKFFETVFCDLCKKWKRLKPEIQGLCGKKPKFDTRLRQILGDNYDKYLN